MVEIFSLATKKCINFLLILQQYNNLCSYGEGKLTESAVMTRERGTKSSFSPFLIFFNATSPLSPTSTRSISIFWAGRPELDNHLWSAEAFSNDSISHPHGTVSPSGKPVETAQQTTLSRRSGKAGTFGRNAGEGW